MRAAPGAGRRGGLKPVKGGETEATVGAGLVDRHAEDRGEAESCSHVNGTESSVRISSDGRELGGETAGLISAGAVPLGL
jgi:hypothetical protein